MIPKDNSLVYSIYSEGIVQEQKRSSGGRAIIVSRVPTKSGERGPAPSLELVGEREELKTVTNSPRPTTNSGRVGMDASEAKTVTGSFQSKSPSHKDFIEYFPSDEFDDAAHGESESEFHEDSLENLKKKHDSILDIEGESEDLVEEDYKVENAFRRELEQNKTVKKPFEKGSNILIFVAVATGIAMYIGYSFMTLFVGKSMSKQEQKQEENPILTRDKNPLQERIDELEAERAISLQKKRFGGVDDQGKNKGNKTGLESILSPTDSGEGAPKIQPNSGLGTPDKKENNASASLPAQQPGSSPSPSPSPVVTLPPPVVVPPAPEPNTQKVTPNTQKVTIDYLALRQSAQQFGSFGIGSSGLRVNVMNNSSSEQVRNMGVGASNELGPLFSPPPRGSADMGPRSNPIFRNRPSSSLPESSGTPGQMPTSEIGKSTVVAPSAEINQEQIAVQQAERQFLSRIPSPKPEVNSRMLMSSAQILPGSKVTGRIMSPIYSIENFNDESRYPILVEDDILDSNGEVRIPRYSIIMAEVSTIAGGVVLMKPVTLVLRDREIPIPPGSIDIRGRNKPLIGKRVSGGQLAALRDHMLLFLLGGLQSAAELANRPRTTSSITNTVSGNVIGSTSSSTTTTPEPDYAAAALQGGLSKVLPGLESQLKRREPRDNDPRIYQINAGTQVDIYITRSLSF